MIFIQNIIDELQKLADPSLQENYDNAGLLTGDPAQKCTGALCCLDITEDVLKEALEKGANLIIAHHPVIFKPLKSLTAHSLVERVIIKAIKNDLAIYAIHTNFDNVLKGVNFALAQTLGLNADSLRILAPLPGKLAKLYTYVPREFAEALKKGLFEAGAGQIGLYEECSFQTQGTGTFKPMVGSDPLIGMAGGPRESVEELKLEIIFPVWLKQKVVHALKTHHPYEEVAYEIILTENEHQEIGSGMMGELPEPLSEAAWLSHVRSRANIPVIRHSALLDRPIKKVAFCGGAGSFLIKKALQAGADTFLTADLKYHDFFEADHKILLMDIGHGESEIGAIAQLAHFLKEKFPTFAVLQTKVITNPVHYYMG